MSARKPMLCRIGWHTSICDTFETDIDAGVMRHYLDCNRCGHRELNAETPVSPALMPYISGRLRDSAEGVE